jgi:hypothetical protein
LRAVTQLHGQWRGWRRSPGGTQRERRESHTLLDARLGELRGRLNVCKAAAAAVGYARMGGLLLLARWFTEPIAAETRN